ncbi:uncharacterized protein LOC113866343 [Abrus precatorius]|uniref:Uncharacterized protein LOC113866343 n=1 Tax=Abrus precatorius TaxID=3816 RepID=A0A8B8LNP3_ABRPR|nr:uncharacterized protein LOC113866343 [Abrus precatorius]
MVSGEHSLSPKMKQPVSDQNVSKTHISPSRHSFRSKPSSKNGRSKRKNSGRPCTSVNLQAYDLNDQSSNSPYYKGLTDQSLAIVDTIASCPPPHAHPLLPSSPYYKGLTDYSLVIGPWNPSHHHHPIPPNNSLSYESSPYYLGLIDYSLALHSPPIQPPLRDSHSSFFSMNSAFYFKNRDEIIDKLSSPHCSLYPPQIKTGLSLKELMVDADVDVGVDVDVVDFLIEEKPLWERISEEGNVGNAFEEETNLGEMELIQEKPLRENIFLEETDTELVTKGVNDDVEMVIEERVLEASNAESELEENADETILEEMELMSDDVGLLIEEKALRERVSERSNVVEEMELKDHQKEKKASESEGGNVSEEGKVYLYTWAAKYQPFNLVDFICNRDKALYLKALVKDGCGCKHFIFEGPPNVGKRSMIRAMLREVFGADRVQVTQECKDFNLKGEMVDHLQVPVKKSLHHVEVNLSETKGYEKHVIVQLFKETYGITINNSLPCSSDNCQAIVLCEAEKLSLESLLYIKWLLEKYKGCNKVFFCCSDESKLEPVKPLCTTVRLSPPSCQEIVKMLEYIGIEEGIKLSRDLVKKITLRSNNNLRQAIRSLEATCRNKDSLKDDDLILTGWEEDIFSIAHKITEEQSPRQLYVIRRKLQSLMIHDVPPDFVYKFLVAELTALVDESLLSGVAKLDKEFNRASEYKFETTKQFGHPQNKQAESDEKNNESTTKKYVLTYLKVEEFIAKFMSWYKKSSEKGNKQSEQLIAGK